MIVKNVNRLVSLLNSDPTEFALCTVVIYINVTRRLAHV